MLKINETIALQFKEDTLLLKLLRPKLPIMLSQSLKVEKVPEHLFIDSLTAKHAITYRRMLLADFSTQDLPDNLASLYVYNNTELFEESMKDNYMKDIDTFLTLNQSNIQETKFADYVITQYCVKNLPLEKQLIRVGPEDAALPLDHVPLDCVPYYFLEGKLRDFVRLGERVTPEKLVSYDKFFIGIASLLSGTPLYYWHIHTNILHPPTAFPPEISRIEEIVYFWLTGKLGTADDKIMKFFECCARSASTIMSSKTSKSFRVNLLNIRSKNYDKYFASPSSYREWELQ